MNYEEKLREIINSKYYNSEDKAVFAKYFPELKENEDERMRKEIIKFLRLPHRQFVGKRDHEKWIAWLEKQKNYIKLPNSAYTSNKDVIEFADKYSHDVWEKLMDNFKKIENYHIGCNDVSDIVLNAIINTYNWLEKQGEKSTIIDIDKMVMQYSQTKDGDFGLPVNCMIRAYRKGINDALSIALNIEKQGNKSVNIDVESMVSSYEQRLKSQGGTKYSPLTNMCLTAFRHGVENTLEELNLKKLEKQGDNKECGNEWKVITGLYKCTKRMFDGTPEGRLLFETGNLYKCVKIHKCVTNNDVAVFESPDWQPVFLTDSIVRKHFIKV